MVQVIVRMMPVDLDRRVSQIDGSVNRMLDPRVRQPPFRCTSPRIPVEYLVSQGDDCARGSTDLLGWLVGVSIVGRQNNLRVDDPASSQKQGSLRVRLHNERRWHKGVLTAYN